MAVLTIYRDKPLADRPPRFYVGTITRPSYPDDADIPQYIDLCAELGYQAIRCSGSNQGRPTAGHNNMYRIMDRFLERNPNLGVISSGPFGTGPNQTADAAADECDRLKDRYGANYYRHELYNEPAGSPDIDPVMPDMGSAERARYAHRQGGLYRDAIRMAVSGLEFSGFCYASGQKPNSEPDTWLLDSLQYPYYDNVDIHSYGMGAFGWPSDQAVLNTMLHPEPRLPQPGRTGLWPMIRRIRTRLNENALGDRGIILGEHNIGVGGNITEAGARWDVAGAIAAWWGIDLGVKAIQFFALHPSVNNPAADGIIHRPTWTLTPKGVAQRDVIGPFLKRFTKRYEGTLYNGDAMTPASEWNNPIGAVQAAWGEDTEGRLGVLALNCDLTRPHQIKVTEPLGKWYDLEPGGYRLIELDPPDPCADIKAQLADAERERDRWQDTAASLAVRAAQLEAKIDAAKAALE